MRDRFIASGGASSQYQHLNIATPPLQLTPLQPFVLQNLLLHTLFYQPFSYQPCSGYDRSGYFVDMQRDDVN